MLSGFEASRGRRFKQLSAAAGANGFAGRCKATCDVPAAAAVPWDAPARDRRWHSTTGDPRCLGTLRGSGHTGREESISSRFPSSCAILHRAGPRLCFYLWDNYTQPPGSPSQMCRAGMELAGLQGEASGKFPCSGQWHKERLSLQPEEFPRPAHPLLSSTSLLPLEWGCPHPHPHGGMSPSAAKMQPASRPCSLPQMSLCGTAGSAAARHPPRSRSTAQGFVWGSWSRLDALAVF